MRRGQKQIDSQTLLDTITPKGLNAARQWYLYDEIRPYCKTLPKLLHHAVNRHVQNLAKESNVTDKRKCQKKLAESET